VKIELVRTRWIERPDGRGGPVIVKERDGLRYCYHLQELIRTVHPDGRVEEAWRDVPLEGGA
jgi:hypothetical protein